MGRAARGGKPDSALVGARYRLVEKLGTGGMSVVWRGYDEILGRQVAVKVLSARLAGDQSFRDRLRQEALAAARLCHPNITGIFDFGESCVDGGVDVPYVVMELNDGESVSRRLGRKGPLPWRDAVTVAAEVASALATAHARGVVHRDVTPANVMLTGAGAKVVDFGISALIGELDAAPDGTLLGTPAYLAPERLGGGHVLPATDVYALGLLLYRSLTGRLPWPAETTTEALRAHLFADPEPIPTLPGMPAEVADLCLRCLTKDPEHRPRAAEVAYRLAAVIGLHAVIPPLPDVDEDLPVAAMHAPAPVLLRRARGVRLRAGLRLGTALHVGGPRPLGGGMFVGGRLLRGLVGGGRLRRALTAGHHRMQAVAATSALLAVLGLVWSSGDEREVGPAQAAAPGSGTVAVASGVSTGCKVRYQVRRDSGTVFDAALTITNTGRRVLRDISVEFAFPGAQRLVGRPAAITQQGRRVVVKAGTLRAGRSVAVPLRGSYRDANPLPLAFALDGRACRVEILGSTVPEPVTAPPATTGDEIEAAEKPRPEKTAPRKGGSAAGKPVRPGRRTAPDEGTDTGAPETSPRPRTYRPKATTPDVPGAIPV